MTRKTTPKNLSLAELLADPGLPQWRNVYKVMDLAASVADNDTEALGQHEAAWAAHVHHRAHAAHLALLAVEADAARDKARRALDDRSLDPQDVDALLELAHAAVDRHRRYADWLTRPIGPRSFTPVDFTARDETGRAAAKALDSGIRRRIFAAALLANRELAAIELAEVEGRTHRLPDGITVDDLRRAAEPVAKVKTKIAAVEKDLEDIAHGNTSLYHAPRRKLLEQKHHLAALLTSGTP